MVYYICNSKCWLALLCGFAEQAVQFYETNPGDNAQIYSLLGIYIFKYKTLPSLSLFYSDLGL
jgi:hypothetical protein